MHFLIDAQLPPGLCHFIRNPPHVASHVVDVGLLNSDDSPIWSHAIDHDMVIVTKDEDFVQRRLLAKSGPQIVWIRVGNCSNRALLQWLAPLWDDVIARLEAGESVVELV